MFKAILTSVFATLKQRSHRGTKVIVDALRKFVTTKKCRTYRAMNFRLNSYVISMEIAGFIKAA